MMTSYSLVLLGILFFHSIRTESRRICKPNAYCTCNQGIGSKYDLNCINETLNLEIEVTAKEVTILCLSNEPYGGKIVDNFGKLLVTNDSSSEERKSVAEWTKLLENLDIGETEKLFIKHCPSLPISFYTIFQYMNLKSVREIYFNSYEKTPINLQKMHFENLTNIILLNLNGNSLTNLPNDIFEGIENLNYLYLNNNNITRVDEKLFESNPKLKVFDIGLNNLTNLEPGIFKHTPNLKLLNIYSNKLGNSLNRDVFRNLIQLESLDLSVNKITKLEANIFDDLKALKVLNLNFNHITELPEGIFNNNQALNEVRFNYDFKSPDLPSGLFSNLSALQKLSLMNNSLSNLPNNIFRKTYKLKILTLSRNFLQTLPNEIFQDNYLLKELDLSKNKLTHLNSSVFLSLGNLVKLDLNDNQLTFIPSALFSNMTKLEELLAKNNKLSVIEYGSFFELQKLQIVDMSQNRLNFGNSMHLQSPFYKCSNLTELNLSNNSISMIFDDWLRSLTHLHILKLNYNNITQIRVTDVQFISLNYPLMVDLSFNKIESVDLGQLETVALAQCDNAPCSSQTVNDRDVRITLEGNPIICDCRSYHLARYFQRKMADYAYKYIKINSTAVRCSSPDDKKQTKIKEIDIHDLICTWDRVGSLTKTNCTDRCECYYRPVDNAVIVDCSNKNFTQLPTILPFGSFVNHTELKLTNNKIKTLEPMRYLSSYKSVTKLYLSRNQIRNVNASYFSPKIQVLELDNNLITQLDNSTLKVLNGSTSLERITLHNNPWQCNCDTQYLLYFLQERFKQIPYLKNITCETSGTPIIEMLVDDLCSISLQIIISSIIVAVMGLLFGISIAFYYRYQHEIRVWLFAHKICLWLVAEKELDRNKKYDAFVSFSHQDEEFVIQHLVPGLEKNPTHPFKLCLHFRDWIPGEWIPNQIVRSVEDSKRTIVVLSPNFLNSVWGKMEFRTAHLKAIKERCARVIIILYKDIGNSDKLDAELKAYLSMNTYLKWDDPWFWDKLRYALPHPPEYCKKIPISGKLKKGNKTKGKSANNTSYNNKLSILQTIEIPNQEEKIRQLNKLYADRV